MSNSKNAIAQIKNLMKQYGFITDEQSLQSFKLQDETIVEVKNLSVGESITKISDAFERVVLEDGVYKLKENFEIEVSEGKITHVREIFLDAVLEDGTKLKIEGEELVEGKKVMVVTEDALIPAPDGQHLLSDGTVVETKDGLIAMVKLPESMEDGEQKDAEIVDEAKKKEGEIEEEEMYSMFKDMLQKISDKMKKMEDKMSSVEAEFRAFKSEPASKPIPTGKLEFNKYEGSVDDVRVKNIMELRNNLK